MMFNYICLFVNLLHHNLFDFCAMIHPELCLISGPMFSGKTTELVKILTGMSKTVKCALVRSTIDTRNSISHLQFENTSSDFDTLFFSNAHDAITALVDERGADGYQAIGIDEAHFFGDGLRMLVEGLLARSKRIYVAGLTGDMHRKGFDNVLQLIPICDQVIFLHSICGMCSSSKGAFSVLKKRDPGDEVNTEFFIGGSENYLAVCRRCLLENQCE